jgi:hypothetical protein
MTTSTLSTDAIRSLPPGPEADAMFAHAVGLPVMNDRQVMPERPYVFVGEDQVNELRTMAPTVTWAPSSDAGQAMDWAEKWLDSESGMRVQRNIVWDGLRMEKWRFEFYSSTKGMPDFVSADAPTAALAIVRGVLLVAETHRP